MAIKGLIFDAYGTLYDVHSVQAKTEELCPGKGDLITQVWRLKQLEYTWLQNSLQDYRDFTYLTQASLEFALRAAGIEPSETITKPLLEKYLDLDPYPEAKEALGALRRRGSLKLAILSNGSTAMLTALVKNSGLDAFLDATISVDGARKFKPHRCHWRQAFRLQGRLDQARGPQCVERPNRASANVSSIARQCRDARLPGGLHGWRSDRFDRANMKRGGVTPRNALGACPRVLRSTFASTWRWFPSTDW